MFRQPRQPDNLFKEVIRSIYMLYAFKDFIKIGCLKLLVSCKCCESKGDNLTTMLDRGCLNE